MLRTIRRSALLAALLAPAALPAQDATLPPARDLVARHVAAIGGRDAIMKLNTVRSVGTFSMPAAGLTGELTMAHSRDGRTMMTVTVPGMGQLAGGYDGTFGWSMNPMQGPRLLEGKELLQMKADAGIPSAILRESPGLTSMETVEKSTLGGVDCYKVKLTYESGRTAYDCYAVETGLLAGQVVTQESAMGPLELTNIVGEYKEFGGIRFPTVMRQQAMGQEQVMTVTSVVFDSPDDAKLFDLPDAVKAIAVQKSAP